MATRHRLQHINQRIGVKLLFALAVFLPLTAFSLRLGGHSIAVWDNVDPHYFVKRSFEVAHTGRLLISIDPPLRYLPLGFVYGLLNPSQLLAERIATLYVAVVTFTVVPIALAITMWQIYDAPAAFTSIAGLLFVRVFNLATPSYFAGSWQYGLTLPVVFFVVLGAHQTIQTDSRRWTVTTAVLLGIIGLHQWTYAALLTVIVGASYLLHRKWQTLAITGGLGSVMAIPLLYLPGANDHMSNGLSARVLPDSGGLFALGEVLNGLLSLDLWLVWIALFSTAILYHHFQINLQTETRVVEIAVAVGLCIVLPFGYVRLYYLDYVVQLFLYPVVFGLAGYTGLAAVQQQWSDKYQRLAIAFENSFTVRLVGATIIAASCWVLLTVVMPMTYH